jgi:DNA-directed RNA polymerase subunit K/omega
MYGRRPFARTPRFSYSVQLIMQNPDTADVSPTQAASQPAEPITSRFLFVDVAAQRAKQLRRGALPRLDRHAPASPHKLERVAMEEVRTGLIQYTLPGPDEFGPGAKA